MIFLYNKPMRSLCVALFSVAVVFCVIAEDAFSLQEPNISMQYPDNVITSSQKSEWLSTFLYENLYKKIGKKDARIATEYDLEQMMDFINDESTNVDTLIQSLEEKDKKNIWLKLAVNIRDSLKTNSVGFAPNTEEETLMRKNISDLQYQFQESAIRRLFKLEKLDLQDLQPFVDSLVERKDWASYRLLHNVFVECGKRFDEDIKYFNFVLDYLDNQNLEMEYMVLEILTIYHYLSGKDDYNSLKDDLVDIVNNLSNKHYEILDSTNEEQEQWYRNKVLFYADKLNKLIEGSIPRWNPNSAPQLNFIK